MKRGRPEKEKENPSNTRNNGSTDKPGTLRRLARSHPDLLARVESGEATKAAVAIARRQTDPESPEFVRPEGAKGIGKRVSNTNALSNRDRNSKPGTLRRLARSHPDLLARVESGELSAHAAAVQAGIRKPMRSIPVDTPDAAIRATPRQRP